MGEFVPDGDRCAEDAGRRQGEHADQRPRWRGSRPSQTVRTCRATPGAASREVDASRLLHRFGRLSGQVYRAMAAQAQATARVSGPPAAVRAGLATRAIWPHDNGLTRAGCRAPPDGRPAATDPDSGLPPVQPPPPDAWRCRMPPCAERVRAPRDRGASVRPEQVAGVDLVGHVLDVRRSAGWRRSGRPRP